MNQRIRATNMMVALVALAALSLSATAAHAAPDIPLRATFSEQVIEQSCNLAEATCTFLLNGSGELQYLGATTEVVSLTVTYGAEGCATGLDHRSLTGPSGILDLEVESEICFSEAGADVVGTWTVTGGSGSFENATGSGTLKGAVSGDPQRRQVRLSGTIHPCPECG